MLPKCVTIHEVGPRDGLQNESFVLSAKQKALMVDKLSLSGLKFIEVSSFVSPKWIPALADASEVFAQIHREPGVQYSALVPNERGLERALQAKADGVNVFLSASESHNLKNIHKTISDTFPVLKPVVQQAKASRLRVRGYVSTAFGCPYEGAVSVDSVRRVCYRLLEMGVNEVSLGDTIGVAVPSQVLSLLETVEKDVPAKQIALHFHDTRGMAIANIWAGLIAEVSVFDASVGGLGGCPYAPGATGNVATEDVLYLLDKAGVQTGVNGEALLKVSAWLENQIGRPVNSHARAVTR